MKFRIGSIGLAVFSGVACMAASPAFAQSNVTVYGLIDLAVVKESKRPTALDRGYLNWLGVMGSEDLGGGLSATFNLMTRFNTDTGSNESSTFWHGESTVGLKSATLGHLRLGRAITPLWGLKYQFDPWGDSWFVGSLGKYQTTGRFFTNPTSCMTAAECPGFARLNNAVFYDSPTFSGFDFHLTTQLEVEPGAARKGSGASINYASGPIKAMVSWERNTADMTALYLGGSYDFGAAVVMGSLGQSKQDNVSTEKSYMVAVRVPLPSSNAFRAGYGRNTSTKDNKISLGLQHFFSKRTHVYVDLYRERIDYTLNGYAVGIQHSF
ncbi:MAG: porin [Aquabacterium sp.]|uniref:porin n=1 Tax=Aquabacterium sp. TaxID=1872578 RepID=UPI003BAED19E